MYKAFLRSREKNFSINLFLFLKRQKKDVTSPPVIVRSVDSKEYKVHSVSLPESISFSKSIHFPTVFYVHVNNLFMHGKMENEPFKQLS